MHKLTLFFLFISISGFAQKISGFSDADAATQIRWEKKFDSLLSTANQDQWMKFMTSKPHHVSSPHGKATAEFMANLFRQWGYDTKIETFHVLFPTPKTRALELLGSKPFKAKLEEPVLKEDRTSGVKTDMLPTYNAYSADGDVTAELVFVNRGVPADYEELERRGISVKGKIVIAKYGGSWRGIKPKVAAEKGAIGCLIYSDPADDGYAEGDVYPKGPYRPSFGAQRGSVMDMPVAPGDPLTPFTGATENAKRLERSEAVTIMRIPVLPISYEDALPLLQALQGPVVPDSWRGGLPITYHMGPSTEKVHLQLAFNWDVKPLYNVIATLKGSDFPDEWVIRGNHHDAWVFGAADPVSGMVSEMEEARVIGEMVKQGYRLKRSLVYCAWDGEEPALLGSTEWVEYHQDELKKKAVAYVNSDGNSRGFVFVGGSHGFEPFFNEIAGEVKDPQTGVSVKQRAYARQMSQASSANRAKMLGKPNIRLSALGAGSDYSPFLQYLGISSFNIGYGGEGSGGEYHSIYDSYDHFTRFKDPGFVYGSALASTAGRVMMRLANADVIPMSFTSFYNTVNEYVAEIKSMADQMRTDAELEQKMAREKIHELAADPTLKVAPPMLRSEVPYFDFSKLDNSLVELRKKADEFQALSTASMGLSADKKKKLNEILYMSERSLVREEGLPRRKWWKHQIYAPGFYTGYGVKTIPGVRESIEERQWKDAQENINIVAETIRQYAGRIGEAIKIITN
ncbi:MAG TPA: transferrin receptor-like dimerization domain-containing protein [Chitinophagaceae bacterium]|nr:transferrin receptor-like dimerization domain-containing protein [Chitinophagaceae bacterium]